MLIQYYNISDKLEKRFKKKKNKKSYSQKKWCHVLLV